MDIHKLDNIKLIKEHKGFKSKFRCLFLMSYFIEQKDNYFYFVGKPSKFGYIFSFLLAILQVFYNILLLPFGFIIYGLNLIIDDLKGFLISFDVKAYYKYNINDLERKYEIKKEKIDYIKSFIRSK